MGNPRKANSLFPTAAFAFFLRTIDVSRHLFFRRNCFWKRRLLLIVQVLCYCKELNKISQGINTSEIDLTVELNVENSEKKLSIVSMNVFELNEDENLTPPYL